MTHCSKPLFFASRLSALNVSFSQLRVRSTVDTKDLDDGTGRTDVVNAVLNMVVVDERGVEINHARSDWDGERGVKSHVGPHRARSPIYDALAPE